MIPFIFKDCARNAKGAWLLLFRCSLFLFTTSLQATDLLPWYSKNLQLQLQSHYLYQHYHSLNLGSSNTEVSADDHFLTFNLMGTYDRWNGQIETTVAKTRRQDPAFDNYRLTGRYLWLDDVVGDPISVSFGLTVTKATQNALRDISSFHHGRIELEGHIALGKEQVCEQFWTSHWWTVFALGAADHGSPWLRFNAGWEQNHWDCSVMRLYVNTLWGLGDSNLSEKYPQFRGYGPISHRSIDVGARYTSHLIEWGSVSADYSYRVYAKNFPKNAHRISLIWLYPFGI